MSPVIQNDGNLQDGRKRIRALSEQKRPIFRAPRSRLCVAVLWW